MKAMVVTDERGAIAGLALLDEGKSEDKDAPEEVRMEPLDGQKVHEVELPAELERMESALEVYEALERDYDIDLESSRLTPKAGKGEASA